MKKWKSFLAIIGIVLIVYEVVGVGTIVYSGPYPHSQSTNLGYTLTVVKFRHDGYKIIYATSPTKLKRDLSMIKITKIIRVYKNPMSYYTFFVDSVHKKVIITSLTLKFKRDEIRALRF